jgi:putative FmdB family regulatory protein
MNPWDDPPHDSGKKGIIPGQKEVNVMPIYEYRCRKCGEDFEFLLQNRKRKPTVTCPKCHSARTQRLMSAFAGKIGNTAGGGASCGSCAATSCGTS